MPSKTEWRELEQSIRQDAFKLDGTTRLRSPSVILGVWAAFYILAITHALMSPRVVSSITTAETQEQSLAGTSRY